MKQLSIISILSNFVLFWCSELYAFDFEVDGIYYNFISSTEVSVTYNNELYSNSNNHQTYKGLVSIPDNVVYANRTYSVSSIGLHAFSGCSALYSVELPNSITHIGGWAFTGCYRLKELILPSSLKTFEVPDLKGNSNLTKVFIPGSLSSGSFNFDGCSSLQELIIADSDIDTPLGFNFHNCGSIQKIYIGRNITISIGPWPIPSFAFIGSKVTNMKNLEEFEAETIVSYAATAYYRPTYLDCHIKRLFVRESLVPKYVNTKYEVMPLYENVAFTTSDVDAQGYQYDLSFVLKNDKSNIDAVYFIGENEIKLTESEIKEGMNPNCLYFQSSTKKKWSNFIDYESRKADKIVLNADDRFFCPLTFTTQDVEINYSPAVWADGQSGWNVIVLPFTPTSIEASEKGAIVPITTGSSGNFWLRQYVGSTNESVFFSSTSDGVIKANTPYIIAFPGDKMGAGSLEGQTITFKAKNVSIPVTKIPSIQKNTYSFVGNYDKTADGEGGWTLNAEGNAFLWNDIVGDKPFSGYFKSENHISGAPSLRIGFSQMDEDTGLLQDVSELEDYSDNLVYTLGGQIVKTETLEPGFYILNRKKKMVK